MRGIHWLPGSVLSAFTPAVVPAMASVMRGAASAHYRRRRGREQRDGGRLAPTGARRRADATVCRNRGDRRLGWMRAAVESIAGAIYAQGSA